MEWNVCFVWDLLAGSGLSRSGVDGLVGKEGKMEGLWESLYRHLFAARSPSLPPASPATTDRSSGFRWELGACPWVLPLLSPAKESRCLLFVPMRLGLRHSRPGKGARQLARPPRSQQPSGPHLAPCRSRPTRLTATTVFGLS
jgi:hypothetical protein